MVVHRDRMQYYTKQQLQGAGAYGPRCRIGNWDEDLMAEETQFKDFLKAKERGELKVQCRTKTCVRAFEAKGPAARQPCVCESGCHGGAYKPQPKVCRRADPCVLITLLVHRTD